MDNIPFKHIPFKEIIFDLGFNINRLEEELIHQVSTKINTKILVPFYFDNKYQNEIYFIYNRFKSNQCKKDQTKKTGSSITKSTRLGKSKPKKCNQTKISFLSKNVQIKKFVTPLAEVKDISNWIKVTLDKGIKPNKICVLAPHIEDYWTCLKSYFNKENIAVNKGETVSLSNFPIIQLWFAKMKTHLAVLKYENLEMVYAHGNAPINFSQLKADFLPYQKNRKLAYRNIYKQ